MGIPSFIHVIGACTPTSLMKNVVAQHNAKFMTSAPIKPLFFYHIYYGYQFTLYRIGFCSVTKVAPVQDDVLLPCRRYSEAFPV